MRRLQWLSVLVIVSLLSLLINFGPAAAAPPDTSTLEGEVQGQAMIDDQPDAPRQAGELLIHFRPGTPGAKRAKAHAAAGGQEILEIPGIDVWLVRVPAGREADFMAWYSQNPNVVYVQPNYIFRPTDLAPDDTCFEPRTCTAHNDNVNVPDGTPFPEIQLNQWGLPNVSAPQAWDTIQNMTTKVKVAVLDTGVDLNHPDLAGQLVPGRDTVYNDNDPSDAEGHGTHVAGIVGAVTNNSAGVSSLGWKAVEIMPVRVLHGTGTSATVANGIIWAADNGAKVMNMSFGGTDYDHALQKALHYAWKKDVLMVAAAGNLAEFGNQASHPASSPFVLAVGAIDQSNQRAAFSTYQFYNAVSAPGVNILSTMPTYDVSFTNGTPGWFKNYDGMSGTSMATPMVASLAAVLRSQNPTATNLELMQRIMRTAVDVGNQNGERSNEFGYGRVNAVAAMNNTARSASVGGILGQTIAANGNPDSYASITATSTADSLITYSTTARWDGHFRLDNMQPGTYTVTARNSDGTNPRTATVTVTAGQDNRTILGSLSDQPNRYGTWWQAVPLPTSILAGSTVTSSNPVRLYNTGTLSWQNNVSPQVGLNYQWINSSAQVVLSGTTRLVDQSVDGGGQAVFANFQVVAPNTAGTYTLELDMQEGPSWFSQLDPLNAQSWRATVVVTAPAPTVTQVAVSPPSASVSVGTSTSLSATVTWSDGTTSSVADWSSSNNSVATVSGGTVTGQAAGTATITATYGGKSGSASVTVTSPVTLQSVTVSPSSVSITKGSSASLTAYANYSNGSSVNVTSSASWSSSNGSVASVSGGTVTGNTAGSATITATYGGKSGSASVTVSSPVTLQSVTVSPSSVSIPKSSSTSLTAYANYSNGSSVNVTSSASWSSSNGSVASVSGGTVTGNAAGSVTVTATYGGKSGSASVTVTNPVTLQSVIVSPSSASIPQDGSVQLSAIATYSDGSTLNVTSSASWGSSNSSVATVSGGYVRGYVPGNATIAATYGGKTGSASVTVYCPVGQTCYNSEPPSTSSAEGPLTTIPLGTNTEGYSPLAIVISEVRYNRTAA